MRGPILPVVGGTVGRDESSKKIMNKIKINMHFPRLVQIQHASQQFDTYLTFSLKKRK